MAIFRNGYRSNIMMIDQENPENVDFVKDPNQIDTHPRYFVLMYCLPGAFTTGPLEFSTT